MPILIPSLPKTTTPELVTAELLSFCATLVPDAQPQFVDVSPSPAAQPGHCFTNVATHAAYNGGRAVYGWTIWEMPGLFLEAEYHTVWASDAGALYDITPKPDGERFILFLPNQATSWDGIPVPNKYGELAKTAACRRFIEASEKRNLLAGALYSRGEPETPELRALEFDKQMCFFDLVLGKPATHVRAPSEKVPRNAPCWCGSQLKFKKCHGR